MSFEPLDFVRHIVAEVEDLERASVGVDASSFAADATLQRAFIRSLEVIGDVSVHGCTGGRVASTAVAARTVRMSATSRRSARRMGGFTPTAGIRGSRTQRL
jgi:hypothetical protein